MIPLCPKRRGARSDDDQALSQPANAFSENSLAAYIAGAEFSAAEFMLGYPLMLAKAFGLLSDDYAMLQAYMTRLEAQPAYQKALS